MPTQTTIGVGNKWVSLSGSTDITSDTLFTIQHQSDNANTNLLIKGGGSTPPTDKVGAFEIPQGGAEASITMAQIWPGSTFTRLWAYSEYPSVVGFAHA